MATADDSHEYLSFEDPAEERTWIFDTTFLRSNWTCIWGAGCQGVLTEAASELQQGCCSYGAHFIDAADVQTVVQTAAKLTPQNWQFHAVGAEHGWSDTEPDGTVVTRLHEDACIFHNQPGFSGGSGCALHAAALAVGERPIDWKPDVCWQLPLRLHEDTDAHGHVTSTLREWKRRDWGEGGAEFHWWCTESADAFVATRPVYEAMREEITEFTGPDVYGILAEQLAEPRSTPLPHPAVRRSASG